jgi:hypothetical protein
MAALIPPQLLHEELACNGAPTPAAVPHLSNVAITAEASRGPSLGMVAETNYVSSLEEIARSAGVRSVLLREGFNYISTAAMERVREAVACAATVSREEPESAHAKLLRQDTEAASWESLAGGRRVPPKVGCDFVGGQPNLNVGGGMLGYADSLAFCTHERALMCEITTTQAHIPNLITAQGRSWVGEERKRDDGMEFVCVSYNILADDLAGSKR